MRTLTLDQFEFETPSSEERLEISIAAKSDFPFPNMLAFASAVLGAENAKSLSAATVFNEVASHGNIRQYLQQYASLALPQDCDWLMYVVSNEWNEWDVLLEGPQTFVRYHWETSA